MKMSIGRRIAEAVGSWLHFEFCCYRAGLFSESSLKAAVGQVLSSFPISSKGVRVHADFPHQALNPIKRAGRYREVDFALVLNGDGVQKNGAEVLVEAKWANSSHCKPSNIVSDFLRLAALKASNKEASCIFLLAGHARDMNEVVSNVPFIVHGKVNTGIIIDAGKQKRFTPDPLNSDHKKFFGDQIFKMLKSGIKIPRSFVVISCGLHPVQSGSDTVDFQAKSWEIVSVSDDYMNLSQWS